MAKNLVLGLNLIQIWAAIFFFFFFFFKNLAPSVTRYYGQLSSCTITEKTSDQTLRKLTDGRTDGQTDGQTDKSDFIGRNPTNVERPTRHLFLNELYFGFLQTFEDSIK